MNITLKTTNSENNRVHKTFTGGSNSFNFDFKDESSVFTPSVIIGTTSNLTGYNYAEISDLGRKYFITDIIVLRANLYMLKLKTDVLSTWADQLMSTSAVLRRQENIYNLYLNDPEFKVLNKEQIVTKAFSGTGFSKNLQFVLTVSGN